ncbi:MAG: laccase domain-containing protein, partial [candidate division WOR-3 bacterium]
VADCLPVFVWAKKLQGIGIAHCGWRGTAVRLAEKLARYMSRHLAVPLSDLCYCLGPCICEQCYRVGPDVHAAFDSFPDSARLFCPVAGSETTWLLSLRRANDCLL